MQSRHGPKPRWGGVRKPCTIGWPLEHREVYEAAAERAGISLNEYMIRRMAEMHGLLPASVDPLPTLDGADPSAEEEGGGPEQLKLGA